MNFKEIFENIVFVCWLEFDQLEQKGFANLIANLLLNQTYS